MKEAVLLFQAARELINREDEGRIVRLAMPFCRFGTRMRTDTSVMLCLAARALRKGVALSDLAWLGKNPY